MDQTDSSQPPVCAAGHPDRQADRLPGLKVYRQTNLPGQAQIRSGLGQAAARCHRICSTLLCSWSIDDQKIFRQDRFCLLPAAAPDHVCDVNRPLNDCAGEAVCSNGTARHRHHPRPSRLTAVNSSVRRSRSAQNLFKGVSSCSVNEKPVLVLVDQHSGWYA